jgi:transketolase
MRFEVVKAIYEAALKDKRIYFISGDMGHAYVDEFKNNLGCRYYNGGMAEQNIIGVAAGLALSGKKVFVYSIVPFITLRCLEQIKVDVCLHNVDVTIIGVGGGFAYGSAGATHYSIEEIAALRALPNMKIVCPANPYEAKMLMGALIQLGGPSYIRIGRGKEPSPDKEYAVQFGRGVVMRRGRDVTIISSGTIVAEAMKVAKLLEGWGISAEVVGMHTIKPLDADLVIDRALKREGIFTLEEHNVIGGLGSAVAEVILESSCPHRYFKRFGVRDEWPKLVGSQEYLRKSLGFSAELVASTIHEMIS